MRKALLDGPRGASTKMRLSHFLPAASELSAAASSRALSRAEVTPDSITHLVTVSCTGAESPGLDHALIERLGLPLDVRRIHVGFMGCHGAINGLAAAAAFAAADPRARALLACAEVCSLHYQLTDRRDRLIANAIFSDGAASAVVGPPDRGPVITAFASRVFPGTAELMRWEIGDNGFEMTLSPRVPSVLRRSVAQWVDEWLEKHGLARADIRSWAVHPGGRDILEGVRRGLDLAPERLNASHGVLDRHGNMSSGTVLWVIDELLRNERPFPLVGMSFGPGLSAEAVLLTAPTAPR